MRIFISLIIIFACLNLNAQYWIQKGDDILGTNAGQALGAAVKLSASGNTLAVSSDYEFNVFGVGMVQVFDWVGSNWVQRGGNITSGVSDFDNWFGETIDLSSDGNTIAIGAPNANVTQVFTWTGSNWVQKGSVIFSNPWSVSIDNSGNMLIVRDNELAQTGEDVVALYMFDGFDWVEMSPEILGEEPGEASGMSVAMSGDGGVVCYGAPNNNGNGTFAGSVRAYSTFGFQLGSEINGSDSFNALGTSSSGSALSLSNSGSRMAVGNRFSNLSAGEVKIYQLTSDWIQMGSAIPGNGSTGNSVELNFDGNKLVVGSHTASPAGSIKTFNWDGSNWVQYGQEILGQNGGDGFGNSVSMSHNGLTIAGGIHGNDSNGDNAGLARVYTFCDATFNTITATSCSSYTVPSGDETYTVSGMYNDTIPNTHGCDSLLTIFLTISNSSSTDFQTACDSFTWIDGVMYSSSTNTPTWMLTNAAGCDSLVTLDLTISNSTTFTDTQSACDSFTWIDGVTYTSSTTTPSWTLTNVAGCDSLVTLDLTINAVDTTVVIIDPITLQSALQGAEYQWLDCNNGYAPLLGETNQTITFQNDGSYALSVTMNNCTDTSSCYSITTIGLTNHRLNSLIRVSRNPSDGHFIINLGDVFENIVVDVFDISGRHIMHNAHGAAKEVECLIHAESGVYIATISIAGKTVIPLRLVKE